LGALATEILSSSYLVGYLSCSQLSSSSPQYGQAIHGQGMHSDLEMYASRLAEAEQRQRAMSTPDLLVCFSSSLLLVSDFITILCY